MSKGIEQRSHFSYKFFFDKAKWKKLANGCQGDRTVADADADRRPRSARTRKGWCKIKDGKATIAGSNVVPR